MVVAAAIIDRRRRQKGDRVLTFAESLKLCLSQLIRISLACMMPT
jgi:hypothetical protein